jgi:hypothetical protein
MQLLSLPCTHSVVTKPCCCCRTQGVLLPTFHRAYWLGYQAAVWPDFHWLDRSANSSYSNWGTPLQGEQQPDNGGGALRAPPELCTAANSSLAGGQESPLTWSDDNCSLRLPFMCRRIGGLCTLVLR